MKGIRIVQYCEVSGGLLSLASAFFFFFFVVVYNFHLVGAELRLH
jgi:hypothetical protein